MSDKIFDLEQRIMRCWNVVDDLEDMYHYIGDDSFFKGMDAEHNDKILNLLLGMKELYAMKFEKCFFDFEEVCKEYHNRKKQLHIVTNERESFDDWDEERMDIIGQNGNDGDHYRNSIDDVTTQEWDNLRKSNCD